MEIRSVDSNNLIVYNPLSMTEDETPRKPLEVGEMPVATIVNTPFGKVAQITAYAPDGTLQAFCSSLIKATFDLTSEKDRNEAADVIGRIKVKYNIDAAVGPEYIEDHHREPALTGTDQRGSIYIDFRRESDFGRRYRQMGLPNFKDLYSGHEQRREYEQVLPRIKAMMPNPPAR